ncbi:MAG: transposase [Candidatus Bipolaricaulis sp.]|nr:transposase [Candidatus Bipolaricaulis sp.]
MGGVPRIARRAGPRRRRPCDLRRPPGLKAALAKELPGTSWQRRRAHFMRNVLAKVPKPAQDLVATLIRSVFAPPAADEVRAQLGRVVKLRPRFPKAAKALEDAAEDILALSTFSKAVWRQIRSSNPQERLNREIRRRTDVVGIFPNRAAIIRLVGAVLAEQTDEWAVSRTCMTQESLAQATARRTSSTPAKEEPALVAQLVA